MTTENPAEKTVVADLASTGYRVGVMRGWWRTVSFEFPILVVAVNMAELDGEPKEYFFRFELTGYPGTAPEVKIWDPNTSDVLPHGLRPRGSNRVNEAFKDGWNNGSIYRPWERSGVQHNNWHLSHPALAWNPDRDLTFILEDLHGLLTSNASANGPGEGTAAGL